MEFIVQYFVTTFQTVSAAFPDAPSEFAAGACIVCAAVCIAMCLAFAFTIVGIAFNVLVRHFFGGLK